MSAAKFKLGVTFHSFAAEYLSYKWSFDDMMAIAATLGGGVEIVGPSHVRGFPHVSQEFERQFKSSVERHGITPICFSSYADPFMLPGRDLTDKEIADYTRPQLIGAAKLGFPVVRLQHFHAGAVPYLLDLAEKLGVKMGYELHVPMMLKSAATAKLVEQIDRLANPHIGLVPDGGLFTRAIAKEMFVRGRKMGLGQNVLDHVQDLWSRQVELPEAMDALGRHDLSTEAIGWVALIWDHFGFSHPDELDAIAKYIVHFHAKFYDMVDGDEPYVQYEGIVKALVRMGYSGWIASELEGSLRSAGDRDASELVREQQDMIRRYASV